MILRSSLDEKNTPTGVFFDILIDMKILSLNTWGGRTGKEAFLNFIKENKDSDIICLQEVHDSNWKYINEIASGSSLENVMVDQFKDMKEVLSEHVGYFDPSLEENYGLAVFSKKNLNISEQGNVFVYKEKGYVPDDDIGNHARNIQYLTFNKDGKDYTVINFHGLWNPLGGKHDIEDRITQSQNIVHFMSKLSGEIILIGDFNLNPDTQSLKMLEDFGLRNLIKEYNITSTRSELYTKPGKYADYCLVTEGVEVKDFKVIETNISDHLPLILEIE